MSYRIPFNKPCLVGNELDYVRQAVVNGHASGDGPFTDRSQKLMQDRFAARRVVDRTEKRTSCCMRGIGRDSLSGTESQRTGADGWSN
jgi:dTDP-4-amino-4,6-dideoxygalactose transaminase